ncbi:MAG: sulfatase-like hydrolase/transferase, partial [Opitutaceae bacterium]
MEARSLQIAWRRLRLVVLLGLAASAIYTAAAATRPNIVIILADDQGWSDLGFNGNIDVSTPNIDSLAASGAVFDRFFVCPICAPTRAEFLTGRYHTRSGVRPGGRGATAAGVRMNLDEHTIAQTFEAAGYATGVFGKWHNGSLYPYHPNARGFDEFYGFAAGHWPVYFDATLQHNGVRVKSRGFIIDDLTDHALEFIEANRSRPFFCYVPFNTPHTPLQVPDRFFKEFAHADIRQHTPNPAQEDLAFTRAVLAMTGNI